MDTAVVFGRACGAASTTLPGENTWENMKKYENYKENIQNSQSWAESPPLAAPCHKKVLERAQRQPRRAKGTQKGDTRTPKRPQRIPKGAKRAPEASQKAQKMTNELKKRARQKL